ncbi:MAG: hypothetical protein OEY97_00205 [Nitrospirota bacterium]|nr:hypothetical protein [Nitrospirota bacterium]
MASMKEPRTFWGLCALFGRGTGTRKPAATAGSVALPDDPYRITLCPSHAGRVLTEEEGRDLWRTA